MSRPHLPTEAGASLHPGALPRDAPVPWTRAGLPEEAGATTAL
jgi:hypothetical protein